MRLSLIAAALATAVALCEGSTKMVIGYFPNWLYANYPVESIPYTKYTHINYAFAILNNEDNIPSFPDDWAVESSLPKVVENAHASKTKVLLSVGGWTGSKRFSPMVATAESRKKFIDWNLDFIEKYNTDGVDIDWEYPGKQAAGCNEFADNDADNFLLLLKELRQALDHKFPKEHKEISMAVHVEPFVKSGVPMTDLKAYVPYFDHVNLMTYDINGAWASTTGPNAPFQSEQENGSPLSFVQSIKDWKKAGVPAEKITAGLAFYGRSMKAQGDMRQQSHNQFQASEVGAPKGDSDDAYWNDPFCNKEPGGLSGIWKWTNLRKEGLLQDDMVTPGKGWERYWDSVSQTPWLFNPETKHYISYDDPQSLQIKVDHAICEDLAGVMVWDIHQDNGELLDAVNKIHTSKPSSCEALLKPGMKAITEESDASSEGEDVSEEEEEVVENGDEDENFDDDNEEIDDLGNTVEPVSSTLAAVEEISLPASKNDDFSGDDEDYDDEDEEPTTTSTKSSSSAKASILPINKGGDLDGKPCENSGEYRCVEAGVSGKWLTCNIDKWLVRDCATDLVCKGSEGNIYCDHPSPNMKAAGILDGIIGDDSSSSVSQSGTNSSATETNGNDFGLPTVSLPSDSGPSFDGPSFEEPSFDAPSFDAPSFDAPSFDAPSFSLDAPSFPSISLGGIPSLPTDLPLDDIPTDIPLGNLIPPLPTGLPVGDFIPSLPVDLPLTSEILVGDIISALPTQLPLGDLIPSLPADLPSISLDDLPSLPSISLGDLPSLPSISLGDLPSLPSISLGDLPSLPSVSLDLPPLPSISLDLPSLSLPDLGLPTNLPEIISQIAEEVGNIVSALPEPEIPKIDIPDIDIPKIDLPEIDVPEIDIPDINIPDINIPDIDIPKIDLPEVDVPEIDIPKIDLPDVDVPEIDIPKIDLPEIDIPDIDIPEIDIPEINIPDIIDLPEPEPEFPEFPFGAADAEAASAIQQGSTLGKQRVSLAVENPAATVEIA